MTALNNPSAEKLWFLGKDDCLARFLSPYIIYPAFVLAGFGCARQQYSQHNALTVQLSLSGNNAPSLSEQRAAILKSASHDYVISNDEVYAYSQTLPKHMTDYYHAPDGISEADIETKNWPSGAPFPVEQETSVFLHSSQKYLHVNFQKTKHYKALDVYFSKNDIKEILTQFDATQKQLGLSNIELALNNGEKSHWNEYAQWVSLNPHEAFKSRKSYDIIYKHELGHAHQYKYRPHLIDEKMHTIPAEKNKNKYHHLSLGQKIYDMKYHIEENYADSIAASLSTDVEGGYDALVGERPDDRQKFETLCKSSSKRKLLDYHASPLERFKNMMLITGQVLATYEAPPHRTETMLKPN